MRYICPEGCIEDVGMSKPAPDPCPDHGPFVYEKQLKRSGPLRRVSEKRAPEARRRGSMIKRGRGFAVAPAQRKKVKGLVCVGCGQEASEWTAIDPAHLWPKGKGGCDHPDCVIPLCRHSREDGEAGCHRHFDEGHLELLPKLIDKGYWVEMAHPIRVHEVSPFTLVERLTAEPELSLPTHNERTNHVASR